MSWHMEMNFIHTDSFVFTSLESCKWIILLWFLKWSIFPRILQCGNTMESLCYNGFSTYWIWLSSVFGTTDWNSAVMNLHSYYKAMQDNKWFNNATDSTTNHSVQGWIKSLWPKVAMKTSYHDSPRNRRQRCYGNKKQITVCKKGLNNPEWTKKPHLLGCYDKTYTHDHFLYTCGSILTASSGQNSLS